MGNKNSTEVYKKEAERAILVCADLQGEKGTSPEALIDELANLVNTMGLEVADSVIAKIKIPKAKYLIGTGKADEIARLAAEREADCIIFDDSLTPAQQKNWEKLTNLCVIDRTEVILDIFAARASTREAVLQVGLARMEYSLPRLTRAWTHLSRQRGGAKGTRGEGETQLEADRRIVLNKINRIKKELKKVQAQRMVQRKKRSAVPVIGGSIVGYTNAGKSSLLNMMTGAGVLVEDKLFATLDPTTRRVSLGEGNEVVLTDTVGFIRKLPHDLVDAFKSTLEETALADFLIHILDGSNAEVEHHYKTTLSVLGELGAGGKPIITVFNKADIIEDRMHLNELQKNHPDAVFISAVTGFGRDELLERIKQQIDSGRTDIRLEIPLNRHDLTALIHRTGTIIKEEYQENHISLLVSVPEKTKNILREYIVPKPAAVF